ncbi:hypothetical protein [Sphingomonas alpina]|uniref:Uncharacterized protein n=1 Tax=Sphingomonas alpina TaxID=653931 RepID=A0A7H0LFU3_9SPHN|nr:hypothetical protein [Sphingomonas alpina]QNQ08546.1 hypothetical protein H3Z74_17600 [Sphingomonas alpina]
MKRPGWKLPLAFGVAVGVGALLPAGWAIATSGPPDASFGTINAARINIVEPNGKYRLVISNTPRFPGLFMGGKEYKHHNRKQGGMLFFNDEGDEVGGMGFGSRSAEGHQSASASILFDQYKQDQTVGMVYAENDKQRTAGLRVWDRPDASIQPLMEMSDRASRASTDAEKDKIRAEMLAHAKANGGVGEERFFAGKQLDDAIVRLADKQGRPRLVMKVGADGQPVIEFLGADGKIVKRITQ